MYVYIYIYIYTHTHTHTYIYIYDARPHTPTGRAALTRLTNTMGTQTSSRRAAVPSGPSNPDLDQSGISE